MDQFSDEPAAASESTYGAPADFNQEEFLNMSTAYFKMLQKAWDSGDMDDLSNYTTDDLFIELTHKRREIKGANLTEIVNLNASLAGFETTPTEYVASVLFTGSLKENGEPTEIKEIWNLVKPKRQRPAGCWPAFSKPKVVFLRKMGLRPLFSFKTPTFYLQLKDLGPE